MPNTTAATPAKRRPGRPPSVDHTKPAPMTARAYAQWQSSQGLSDSEAARVLGTAPSTIGRYRERGGSYVLALACAAVAAGLDGWEKKR